jgi:hypothetical protein
MAGPLPARLAGATRLVSAPTYPRGTPRLQYDHLLALGPLTATAPEVRVLPVGDHRLVTVTVAPG